MILLSSLDSFILQINPEGIISSIEKFGIVNGIVILVVSVIAYLTIKKYEGTHNKIIEGKQAEIDR